MKFTSAFATLAALPLALSYALPSTAPAPLDKRLVCAQASRFGVFTVTPTTLKAGDTYTIKANYSCAIEYFGINPSAIEYYLEVPVNNNGHEPDILLASRPTPVVGEADEFTGTVPFGYFFNASYAIVSHITYASKGTDGSPVYVVGGLEQPVSIIVS